MPILIILTFLLGPTFAIKFNILSFPTNVLMVWIVIVWIISAVWLIATKKVRDYFQFLANFDKKILIFTLLFFLAGFISLFAHGFDRAKLGQFIVLYVQPVSLFFIVGFIWRQQPQKRTYFVWATFLIVAISGIYAIIQYFTLKGLPMTYWGNSIEPKRAVSFFMQPDFYSLFTAPLLAFLLPFIDVKEKTSILLGKSLLWILGAAGLLLSLSRSGWIGLFVAAIVFLFTAAARKIKITAAVLSVIIIIIVIVTPILRYRVILPFMGDKSTVSRYSLWHTGWKAIQESPVTGLGLNGFGNNWLTLNTDKNLTDTANFPHNIFLDFWVDTGILGLIAFIGIAWIYLYRGFKDKTNIFKYSIALFLLCLIVQGQFDNPYFRNDLALVFWLILSLSIIITDEATIPKHLYHGSPNTEIEELHPRAETVRDPEEGPVVFATPDKVAAIKNLFRHDDSWVQMACINGVHVALITDKDRFIKTDIGGACYELPVKGFFYDSSKTTAKNEWVSEQPVKPIRKEIFSSALDAMISYGVQVYFLEQSALGEFRSVTNKLKVLEKHQSENEKRALSKANFALKGLHLPKL